jgi:beta-aspartyl-peptidase (threonine type)
MPRANTARKIARNAAKGIAKGIALIAHGGAGGRAPASERATRRRALLAAVDSGARILRDGGSALDAVAATVKMLEDDPLFNAGYGSVLTLDGQVEMDAAVMVAEHSRTNQSSPNGVSGTAARDPASAMIRIRAGGVVLVSRVRNPILLARAVMELTPHVLLGGAAAERLARRAGLELCRPDELISERSRERWRKLIESRATTADDEVDRHGTVGAVALDAHGDIAAATSTGGISGKLPGRIGDSAIIGAGLFGDARGGASATGTGEAILRMGLCREAVLALEHEAPTKVAERAIARLAEETNAQAGIVLVDSSGRIGYAHNAQAMQIAIFDSQGLRHFAVEPRTSGRTRRNSARE